MPKAGYTRHLRSGYWAALRQEVFRRAGGTCERCKVRRCEEAHHLTYERFGHELPEDVEALCWDCHRDAHGFKPKARKGSREHKRKRMRADPWHGAKEHAEAELAATARRLSGKKKERTFGA